MPISFISFPKSGRTWMRYVFHLLNCRVSFTHAGHGSESIAGIGEVFSRVDTSVLLEKNIFMYRNPLDTAVSLYFQIHKFDFTPAWRKSFVQKCLKLGRRGHLPPKDMNKFVLHPAWGVENIARFNRAWLDFLKDRNDSLVISYEAARENPAAVFQRLIDFAGLPAADVEALVEQTTFESMKKLELSAPTKQLMLRGLKNNDPESMKVRKGVVRGYAAYLSPQTIETARELAARHGFEI